LIAKTGPGSLEGKSAHQATANDGERIRAAGAPAVRVNAGTGCHLEADMVARGPAELKPALGSAVMIENVENLVASAMFDLGERAKVVILSSPREKTSR
jgi:hydrogenase nickel incorporation protein HypB